MTGSKTIQSGNTFWQHWRGLGGWNFYFLVKFALVWSGYLNFHPLENLVFMAFLLFPLPSTGWHRGRNIIALPIGIGLFYYDSWLPGINSIMSQGAQLASFSPSYLLELFLRFINLQMLGIGFVMLVTYLFAAQWIRITLFTVVTLAWLNIVTVVDLSALSQPTAKTATSAVATPRPAVATTSVADKPITNAPPTNANLTAYLEAFYQQQKTKVTPFPTALPAEAQPFDLLVINICSLAWADLEATNLQNHPLWGKMDIMFTNFNSATAYSGPAAIRLLRASCGQSSHQDLYLPADPQCYLFNNLAKLGFKQQLMLDHSGVFGNFLKELREQGDMQAPLMSQAGLSNQLASFDGEPIYNDLELLNRWLEQQKKEGDTRSATFLNIIPLHDGNRFVGTNQSADYQPRAETLLNQLNTFLDELQKSGRKVMVVIVPEHGAALQGDKMQISGLRDIPSPSITHAPVGIKLVGMQAPHQGSPLEINTPSSFLALSELVARLVDGKVFTAPSVDWQALIQGLPQTEAVSENDNAIVMEYQGKPYIRLNGGDWVPYPQ